MKCSGCVCDKIERRMLCRREQNRKPLAHQIGMNFGDPEVAIIFRVVSGHQLHVEGSH
jgi:hypothetical protein